MIMATLAQSSWQGNEQFATESACSVACCIELKCRRRLPPRPLLFCSSDSGVRRREPIMRPAAVQAEVEIGAKETNAGEPLFALTMQESSSWSLFVI